MLEVMGGVVIGLMLGATAVWLWMDRDAGRPESVETLKRENECFREEVNEHFVQTAELINQLTDSYKAVFDHLSEGAEKLVDPEVVRERMPRVTDEEVRLKRIGAPRPAEDEQEAAAEPEPASESESQAGPEPETEPEQAAEQESEPERESASEAETGKEKSERGEEQADAEPDKAEAESDVEEKKAESADKGQEEQHVRRERG